MKRWGPVVWLSVVRDSRFAVRGSARSAPPNGAYLTCCRESLPLVGNLQRVTTVHASGQPRAVQQPSDNVCSSHCQIQA